LIWYAGSRSKISATFLLRRFGAGMVFQNLDLSGWLQNEGRGKRKMSDEFKRGYAAHVAWEKTRGDDNECDAETTIREDQADKSVAWWNGWLTRSDEWRDEIGHDK